MSIIIKKVIGILLMQRIEYFGYLLMDKQGSKITPSPWKMNYFPSSKVGNCKEIMQDKA